MNVILRPEIEDLVRQKIESGDYSDETEVIETALRRMDEQDRLAWLREAVRIGLDDIDRGDTVRMTPSLREEMIANAMKRAQAGEKPSADVTP